MLWFDYAIWFILNNLERFFDSTYPTLAAKFGAFITWFNGAAKIAICHQITFIAFCCLMEVASVEYFATLDGRLLAKFYKALGARQVERFIKLAQFSIETLPSPGPTSYNWHKLNLNVPDNGEGYTHEQRPARSNAYSCYGHAQTRRGRGGYNKNYCSPQQEQNYSSYHSDLRRGQNSYQRQGKHPDQPCDTKPFVQQHGSHAGLSLVLQQARGILKEMVVQTPLNTRASPSSVSASSTVSIKPWTNPLKGRILD